MSYKIQYDGPGQKIYLRSGMNIKHIMISLVLILTLCISPVRNWILGSFLPANVSIAVDAFDAMVENIEAGDKFWDAVNVFCGQIALYE